MGWKGTMRSFAAAARAAERDAQRRHKQSLKSQMVADSLSAVEDWENYIHDLVSIHASKADMIDWIGLANTPRPSEPVLRDTYQKGAGRELRQFRPKFTDWFRGGSKKVRLRLEQAVATAEAKDKSTFHEELAAYKQHAAEWDEDTALARRLLSGDVDAIKNVLEEMQSLTDHSLIGTTIGFSIAGKHVHAVPRVHGEDIVPRFRRKQLASGRLSETKMPIGQFNELYQDYVTSVALKTAGDLFHILPLEDVYVTCEADLLNQQTGHKEWTPILSVHFVRDTFMKLNLAYVDPSDAMRNFRHAMSFSKSRGFGPVGRLETIVA